jgi:hypothetical protein
MTLYNKIRNREREIAKIPKTVTTLREMGHEISGGNPPNIEAIANELLNSQEYASNPIARQLKSGMSLKDIAESLLEERTYSLKFRKGARKDFNRDLEYLSELVKVDPIFKIEPIFSTSGNPETKVIYGALSGILFAYGINHASSGRGGIWSYLFFGGAGIVWGAIMAAGIYHHNGPHSIQPTLDESDYIDTKLETSKD